MTTTEFSNEFNSLLAGEISAVETYDLVIKKGFDSSMKETINRCKESHIDRVNRLTECVLEAGGSPSTGSGPWGAFRTFVQGTAGSARDALALLEQFEAESLVQYEAQKEIVPPPVLMVLDTVLLPAQHETHLAISAALKALSPLPTK